MSQDRWTRLIHSIRLEKEPSDKSAVRLSSTTKKLKELYRSQTSMPKLIAIDDARLDQSWDKHYVQIELCINLKNDGDEDDDSSKEIINIDKVFDEFGQKAAKKILLLGAGGSGKSTLFQYICYAWANDKLWKDKFDFVYRVRLAKLLESQYKLICTEDYSKCVARLVRINFRDYLTASFTEDEIIDSLKRKSTLLLVDGYNEIESIDCGENREINNIMTRILCCENVIMSSRYNSMKSEYNKSFDRIVENKGLEYKQIYDYIDSYFGNDAKGTSLKNFLEHNDRIRGLCELPINITLVCLIWSDEETNVRISKTGKLNVGSLYESVVDWFGVKYYEKFSNDDGRRQGKNVFKSRNIQFVQILAYDSFIKNGNYVDNKMIKKVLKHMELDKDEVCNVGLLKAPQLVSNFKNDEYEFIHPTIQEFLAANNAKKLIESGNEAIFLILAEHRNESQFLSMLKFMASIIANVEIDQEGSTDLIEKFWDTIMCNVDKRLEFGNEAKIGLIMHLLEQSRIPKVIGDKQDYSLDERIPNLKEMQQLVDDTINGDFTIWKNVIIESGYISEKMAKRLFVAFDNHEDNSNAKAALEIMAKLSFNSYLGSRSDVCNRIIMALRKDDWHWNKLCLDTVSRMYDPKIKLVNCNQVVEYAWDDNLRPFVLELILKVTQNQPDLSLSLIQGLKSQLTIENCKDPVVCIVITRIIDALNDHEILSGVVKEIFAMMIADSETNIYAYNGKRNFKEILALTNSLLSKGFEQEMMPKFMSFIKSAEADHVKLYLPEIENCKILLQNLLTSSNAILDETIALFKNYYIDDDVLKGKKCLLLYLQINKSPMVPEKVSEIFKSFQGIPRELWINHNFHEVSHCLLQNISSENSIEIQIRVDLCDVFGLNPKNLDFFINFIKDRPKIDLCDFIQILRAIRCVGFNYHNIKMIVLNLARLERARNPNLFQLLKKSYYQIKDNILMKSIIHAIGELFDERVYSTFFTAIIQSDDIESLKSEAVMYLNCSLNLHQNTAELQNKTQNKSIESLYKIAIGNELEQKSIDYVFNCSESDLFTRNVHFCQALDFPNGPRNDKFVYESLDVIACSLKSSDVNVVGISLDHFSRILDSLNNSEISIDIMETIIKTAIILFDLMESDCFCESDKFNLALLFMGKLFKLPKEVFKDNKLFTRILNQISSTGKIILNSKKFPSDDSPTLKSSIEDFLNFLMSINKNHFSNEIFERLFDHIMETNVKILEGIENNGESDLDILEMSVRVFELLLVIIEKSSIRFKLVDTFNKSIISNNRTIYFYDGYKDSIYNEVTLSGSDFAQKSPESLINKYVENMRKVADYIFKYMMQSLKSDNVHVNQLLENILALFACINSSYLSYRIYEYIFVYILSISSVILRSIEHFQRSNSDNFNSSLNMFFLNVNAIYDLYVSSKNFNGSFMKIINEMKRISCFEDMLSRVHLQKFLFDKFHLRYYDCFDITSIYSMSTMSANVLTSISQINCSLDIGQIFESMEVIEVDVVIALIKMFEKFKSYLPACTTDMKHFLRIKTTHPSEYENLDKILNYVLFFWNESSLVIDEVRKFSMQRNFDLKQFFRIFRNQNYASDSKSVILEEIFKPFVGIMLKLLDMFGNALNPTHGITESSMEYFYNIFPVLEYDSPQYVKLERFLNNLSPIINEVFNFIANFFGSIFARYFSNSKINEKQSQVLRKLFELLFVVIETLQRYFFEDIDLDYKNLMQKCFLSHLKDSMQPLKLEEICDKKALEVIDLIEPYLQSNFSSVGISINIFATTIVIYNELNVRPNELKKSNERILKIIKERLDVIENSLVTDCERNLSTLIYFLNTLNIIEDLNFESDHLKQFIDHLSKIVDKSVELIENSLKADLNNFEILINHIPCLIKIVNCSDFLFKAFEKSFIRLLSMSNGMLGSFSVNLILNYLISILKSLQKSSQSFIAQYSQIIGPMLTNSIASLKKYSKSDDTSLDTLIKLISLIFEHFTNACKTHTIFEEYLEQFTNVMKYIIDANTESSDCDDKVNLILCFLKCVDDSNLNSQVLDKFSEYLLSILVKTVQDIEDSVNSKRKDVNNLMDSIKRILTALEKFYSKDKMIDVLENSILLIANKLINTCSIECSMDHFMDILKITKWFQYDNFENMFRTKNSTLKIIHRSIPNNEEWVLESSEKIIVESSSLDICDFNLKMICLNNFDHYLEKIQYDWRTRVSGKNYYAELSLYITRYSTLEEGNVLVPLYYFEKFLNTIDKSKILPEYISEAISRTVSKLLDFAIDLTKLYGLGFKMSLWYFQKVFKVMKISEISEIFKISYNCVYKAWIGILKLFSDSFPPETEISCGRRSIKNFMEIFDLICTSCTVEELFDEIRKITLKLIKLITTSTKLTIEYSLAYFVDTLSICKKIVNASKLFVNIFSHENMHCNGIYDIFKKLAVQNKNSKCVDFKIEYFATISKLFVIFPERSKGICNFDDIIQLGRETLELIRANIKDINKSAYEQIDTTITLFRFSSRACISKEILYKFKEELFALLTFAFESSRGFYCNMMMNFVEFFDYVADLAADEKSPIMEHCLTFMTSYVTKFDIAHYHLHSRFDELFTILRHNKNIMVHAFLNKTLNIMLKIPEIRIEEKVLGLYRLIQLKLMHFPDMLTYDEISFPHINDSNPINHSDDLRAIIKILVDSQTENLQTNESIKNITNAINEMTQADIEKGFGDLSKIHTQNYLQLLKESEQNKDGEFTCKLVKRTLDTMQKFPESVSSAESLQIVLNSITDLEKWPEKIFFEFIEKNSMEILIELTKHKNPSIRGNCYKYLIERLKDKTTFNAEEIITVLNILNGSLDKSNALLLNAAKDYFNRSLNLITEEDGSKLLGIEGLSECPRSFSRDLYQVVLQRIKAQDLREKVILKCIQLGLAIVIEYDNNPQITSAPYIIKFEGLKVSGEWSENFIMEALNVNKSLNESYLNYNPRFKRKSKAFPVAAVDCLSSSVLMEEKTNSDSWILTVMSQKNIENKFLLLERRNPFGYCIAMLFSEKNLANPEEFIYHPEKEPSELNKRIVDNTKSPEKWKIQYECQMGKLTLKKGEELITDFKKCSSWNIVEDHISRLHNSNQSIYPITSIIRKKVGDLLGIEGNIRELQDDVVNLDQKKADRSEIQPHALVGPDDILNDEKLSRYCNGFHSCFISSLHNAIVASEGEVVIDNSNTYIDTMKAALNIFIPPMGNVLSTAYDKFLEQPSFVKATSNLLHIGSGHDERLNIIKELSIKVTRKRKEFINSTDEHKKQLKKLRPKKKYPIAIIKKLFFGDSLKQYYPDITARMGCIDAMKIIHVIKKGKNIVKASNEKFIKEMSEVPFNYEMKRDFKYSYVFNDLSESNDKNNEIPSKSGTPLNGKK